jgi:hypothetical protein
MRRLLLLVIALALPLAASSGCAPAKQQKLPQLPPPAPILADDPGTPGTPEAECQQVVADLKRYGQCGLLDEDRRWWMTRWSELVEIDLALVKNPKLDDASKQQIGVACRKAAVVVSWAATVCAEQAAEQAARPTGAAAP